jgi:hypothetical protein
VAVADSSNTVKSKSKAFTLVAVSFFEDAKDFEVTNDVFDDDTQTTSFPLARLTSLLRSCRVPSSVAFSRTKQMLLIHKVI